MVLSVRTLNCPSFGVTGCKHSSLPSLSLSLSLSEQILNSHRYYLNPSTYWIGGVISATLPSIPIQCTPSEAAHFNPPPGQTCSQYASSFVQQVGTGYLINPDATGNCGYCQFSNGGEFMATLNVNPADKWKYFGIFLAFCISNWALVYFFIYTVRIRGWSFGLGTLFGWLGKRVDAMKALFSKLVNGSRHETNQRS